MFNPSMGGGADLSSKPAYSTTYSTNDCKGYTEKPCWGWRDGGWGVGLENTLIPVLYHQHHKYLQEDNIHCHQAGRKLNEMEKVNITKSRRWGLKSLT